MAGKSRFALHLTVSSFFLLASCMLCGCGASGPKLNPVRGKVLFMDQPAEGATIVFQPKGGANAATTMPFGTVLADGSFSLTTDPHGEGAPAGDYSVLISWHPPDAREQNNPHNKLPAKYSDPTAPLLTATVQEGENDLPPFKLTK